MQLTIESTLDIQALQCSGSLALAYAFKGDKKKAGCCRVSQLPTSGLSLDSLTSDCLFRLQSRTSTFLAQLKEVSAKQLKGVQLELLTVSVFVRLILARGTGLSISFHWPCSRNPLKQRRGEFLMWCYLVVSGI